jgi:Lateral organ boundaries (LOB) domain
MMDSTHSSDTTTTTTTFSNSNSSTSPSPVSAPTQYGMVNNAPIVVLSPCAACKILRRRCVDKCVLAPYFPPTEPHKFTTAHRVFGASNIIKLLQVQQKQLKQLTFITTVTIIYNTHLSVNNNKLTTTIITMIIVYYLSFSQNVSFSEGLISSMYCTILL